MLNNKSFTTKAVQWIKDHMPAFLGHEQSSFNFSACYKNYMDYYQLNPKSKAIKHYFGAEDLESFRIAIHYYQNPHQARGTFFLLHGYYDHVGLLAHIIHFLLELNYDVVAYDLPGHGLSSGALASIDHFDQYTNLLKSLLDHCLKRSESSHLMPKPWNFYGHSTGAAIITSFLSKTNHESPHQFKHIVLSAPLIRPYRWRLAKLQLLLLRNFIKQIPRSFQKNSNDQLFLDFIRYSDPLSPKILPVTWVNALANWINEIENCLESKIDATPIIIQGKKDTTVDGEYNIKVLYKLYSNLELLWLPNARHHLPNEILSIRMQYLTWLTKYLT